MKLKIHTIGAQTITVAALLLMTACSQPEDRHDRMQVVVTIPPLAEFVEQIGGNKVHVSIMVPAGASPHSYEPTPGQLTEVAEADLYVKVGTPVEFEIVWLEKLLATNPRIRVCSASKGIDLISVEDEHSHTSLVGHGHTNDPHVWVSPENARVMVTNIYQCMIAIDEKNGNYYTANKDNYLRTLDSLDSEIRRILGTKKNKIFLVFHPAWSYFARTYGIEQLAIEIEGKEPTAQMLQATINRAREAGTDVIFTSPQFNTKSAEVIAREIEGTVIHIDPLERNYTANMGKIARLLAQSLE